MPGRPGRTWVSPASCSGAELSSASRSARPYGVSPMVRRIALQGRGSTRSFAAETARALSVAVSTTQWKRSPPRLNERSTTAGAPAESPQASAVNAR